MSTIVQSEIINLLSKAENIESVLQIPTYIEAVKDAIMTKMILPLDFFLLGGAFISPCENEELTVESGIPACQLAKPNNLEYPENNRSQPVEQPEEYIKMSPLPSC